MDKPDSKNRYRAVTAAEASEAEALERILRVGRLLQRVGNACLIVSAATITAVLYVALRG